MICRKCRGKRKQYQVFRNDLCQKHWDMQKRDQHIPQNRKAFQRVRMRQESEKAKEWLIKSGMTY